MPKATKAIVTVEIALQLRDMLRKAGKSEKIFHCEKCGWVVIPDVKSKAGAAHFEHVRRNLECPLSDKRTVRKAYTAFKSTR